MFRKSSIHIAVLFGLTGLTSAVHADIAYTITEIKVPDSSLTTARVLNNNGLIVGYYSVDGLQHAFASQNGIFSEPATLGGNFATPRAVNNSGTIAGESALADNQTYHAFVSRAGQAVDLGTLGGQNSFAYSINASGQVVGRSDLASPGSYHAFMVDANGVMSDMGTLGGNNSEAFGINDYGLAVGTSSGSWTDETGQLRTFWHAFSKQYGGMVDLGTLGGPNSEAVAVNANGQIAGTSDTSFNQAQNQVHVFVYQYGAKSDYGNLGGLNYARARGINNYGQVVGEGLVADRKWHAFASQHGALVDLNGLIDPASGWTLEEALAINDNGEILAIGAGPSGFGSVLLKPVNTAPPSVTIQPSQVSKTVTGTAVISATVCANMTGGQAPLRVKWTAVGLGALSVSDPADNCPRISASVLAGESARGTVTAVVTDARGRTSQASASITFIAKLPKGKVPL
ncbi:hypothetical protein [Methylococcus mesophilus]|uniref:hypothetical protein n=1 Tax=Methylococcus mesophilus TaxID=2993564 RepID=UPI00224AA1AC|nr:hypothetical protein [Methylococcus mesophilus]UZR27247.1 hypothetical protein OOT43_10915 [Methylococcus mesophilus]